MGKSRNSWVEIKKTTKEILITTLILLISILITAIMNMQNKLYTIQFSHHPKTESRPVPKQRLWNPECEDFTNFTELSKKTKLPGKKKRI